MTKRADIAAKREKAQADLRAIEDEERAIDKTTIKGIVADLEAARGALDARRKALLNPEAGRRLDNLMQMIANEAAAFGRSVADPVPVATLPPGA